MMSECCCSTLKSARFDLPSYTGCWLCVDAELSIGQCRLGGAQSLWSEQSLAPPAEDVTTGLEFLVDLPM